MHIFALLLNIAPGLSNRPRQCDKQTDRRPCLKKNLQRVTKSHNLNLKTTQTCGKTHEKSENYSRCQIVEEIKYICLNILKKPQTYNIKKIKLNKKNCMTMKDSKLNGNIEAEIISNCAKILGYTVT